MNSMVGDLGQPYAVSERNGVTLIFDAPNRTVFADRVDGGRFAQLFALVVLAALPLWINAFHFTAGFIGAFLITLAGGVAAGRYAQLRVHQVTWWRTVRPVLWRDGRWFAFAFVAQWLADATQPQTGGVGFIGWVYLGLVAWFAWKLAKGSPWDTAYAIGHEIKSLPRAIVALDALRLRDERMRTDAVQLAALPVFDAETPDLLAAWAKKDADAIEALLRKGDALNRASWEAAIGLFNAANTKVQ